MQTPWGDISVCDAHVHSFSYRFFSLLAEQKDGRSGEKSVEAVGAILGWEMPPEEPELLAKRWVSELDRHGVERASLIASLPGDEDSVATAVARYPKRFYGYFMSNPSASNALARVEKALSGGRLQGICLFPAMHRYSIQDERVWPILELASARPGTIVFVHCGVLTLGVRRKLGLPSPFDLRFSNPADLHAVAARFPQVNFVIPHFGAGYLREALMVCDLCSNVYLDTSSGNSWVRYLETRPDLKEVFQRALEVVGARRLLFGTDSSFFPRGWQTQIFEEQVRVLHEIGLRQEAARAILGGNLAKLLARN
jgi:predicted TIM-barrel fold metal-dependent hydrolase